MPEMFVLIKVYFQIQICNLCMGTFLHESDTPIKLPWKSSRAVVSLGGGREAGRTVFVVSLKLVDIYSKGRSYCCSFLHDLVMIFKLCYRCLKPSCLWGLWPWKDTHWWFQMIWTSKNADTRILSPPPLFFPSNFLHQKNSVFISLPWRDCCCQLYCRSLSLLPTLVQL